MDTEGFVFHALKLVPHLQCMVCVSVGCVYRTLHADLNSQLDEFRQHLEHSAREIPDLKAWQLQGSH